MPIIETNGAILEYIEKGQGNPVVFVHGSLNDLRSWSLQMGPFSKQYRAIAYSRRYHYPYSGSCERSDYSVEIHADGKAVMIMGGRGGKAPKGGSGGGGK